MTQAPAALATPAPASLLPVVAGGLVAGLVALVSSASFAALLFTGPLTAFVGPALGWAVLATLAHLLVLARLCSLPGTLGTAQSIPIAVLAAALAVAVQAVTAQGAAAGPAPCWPPPPRRWCSARPSSARCWCCSVAPGPAGWRASCRIRCWWG
jgi:hypothetical protein